MFLEGVGYIFPIYRYVFEAKYNAYHILDIPDLSDWFCFSRCQYLQVIV